jgi:hypothetical protein
MNRRAVGSVQTGKLPTLLLLGCYHRRRSDFVLNLQGISLLCRANRGRAVQCQQNRVKCIGQCRFHGASNQIHLFRVKRCGLKQAPRFGDAINLLLNNNKYAEPDALSCRVPC